MPVEILSSQTQSALPVWLVEKGRLEASGLPPHAVKWARRHGFDGSPGTVLTVPDEARKPVRRNSRHWRRQRSLHHRPPGFCFALGHLEICFTLAEHPNLPCLGCSWAATGLTNTRATTPSQKSPSLAPPEVDSAAISAWLQAVFLARDLVNIPANDMGPQAIEAAARSVASRFKAKLRVITGAQLLKRNFPMIHAVGRAAA